MERWYGNSDTGNCYNVRISAFEGGKWIISYSNPGLSGAFVSFLDMKAEYPNRWTISDESFVISVFNS